MQFAAILVVVGLIVMDPLAGFLLLALAGVFTAIVLAFGSRRLRLVAVILLAIITLLAVGQYPDARLHLQRYREQAHKQSINSYQNHGDHQKERGRIITLNSL